MEVEVKGRERRDGLRTSGPRNTHAQKDGRAAPNKATYTDPLGHSPNPLSMHITRISI